MLKHNIASTRSRYSRLGCWLRFNCKFAAIKLLLYNRSPFVVRFISYRALAGDLSASPTPEMEFSVFQRQQDHLTEPSCHQGTRTVINLVLAAGLAQKIGQNAIKLTTEAEWKEVKRCARNYTPALAHALRTKELNPIPLPAGRLEIFLDGKLLKTVGQGLPPREVENCWFEQPRSDTWRLQHRMVSFLSPKAGREVAVQPEPDGYQTSISLPQRDRGIEGLVPQP